MDIINRKHASKKEKRHMKRFFLCCSMISLMQVLVAAMKMQTRLARMKSWHWIVQSQKKSNQESDVENG